MTTFIDRLSTTISNTPGTSSGFTISTAVANYITFGAGQDQQYFDILALDAPNWEIRTNCQYTNSGTTLSRGTLVTSSSGSAVNLTSASIVSNILTAERLQAIQNSIPIDANAVSFYGAV